MTPDKSLHLFGLSRNIWAAFSGHLEGGFGVPLSPQSENLGLLHISFHPYFQIVLMLQAIFLLVLDGDLLSCLIHLEALGSKKMTSFPFLSSVCEVIVAKPISLITLSVLRGLL